MPRGAQVPVFGGRAGPIDMAKMLRRTLVFIALMFWQGGFAFYSGVAVPIGTEILGSAVEQGFITQRVTVYMNLAGIAAVVVMAWDLWAGGDPSRWRKWPRVLCLVIMAGGLVLLYWLHPQLDELLDAARSRVVDRPRFRSLHRVYLWTSTIQWAAAVVWVVTQPSAWRAEDRQAFLSERAGDGTSQDVRGR
jgi:hypothetical protein